MELSPQLQSRLDQIAKLSRAARMGILFGIAALLAAGYYFGSYSGQADRLTSLRAKELELQRKLSEVRSIAANIAAFEHEITQLEARTRAYGSRKRMYMECTVSTEQGRTWQEYLAGTQSRIVLPCPHCHQWVSPEREHLTHWQRAESQQAARNTGAFGCPSCGEIWGEEDRRAANQACRLLHAGQSIDDAGNVAGTYFDRGGDRSFSYTVSGSLTGAVQNDGSLSVSGREVYVWSAGGKGGGRDKSSGTERNTLRLTASVVLDALGNLVGTTKAGESFTWTRP